MQAPTTTQQKQIHVKQIFNIHTSILPRYAHLFPFCVQGYPSLSNRNSVPDHAGTNNNPAKANTRKEERKKRKLDHTTFILIIRLSSLNLILKLSPKSIVFISIVGKGDIRREERRR